MSRRNNDIVATRVAGRAVVKGGDNGLRSSRVPINPRAPACGIGMAARCGSIVNGRRLHLHRREAGGYIKRRPAWQHFISRLENGPIDISAARGAWRPPRRCPLV